MEFTLGVLVGVAFTLLVLGVGVLLLLQRSVNMPLPAMSALEGEPAVMVMMIEPFLNHQLRDALAAETEPDPKGFTDGRIPRNASRENPSSLKPARVKIKLNDAMLDVQTGQRARFYAQLTVTAWNFPVPLRPIADMAFGLQDGRVKITVTGVQLGGFNVPRALVDRFVSEVVNASEAKLNHSLLQLQQDTGVQLANIETTEDLLILKFVEPPVVTVSMVQEMTK